jgi:cellulose synthase/poly-beta-1,6-N-acetylglucosamine synthase-like glycosyltransferase
VGMIFWWIGLAWLGYVFAGYPLLLAVMARLRRIRPRVSDDFLPTVSVLISARNEEKDIGWKVRETLDWDYPPDRLDIWVASDASDDRTDGILAKMTDPRVHFVRMEQRGGKSRALNRMAQLAQGSLFFFTDANSHIDRSCLRRVARHFAEPKVGCVTGNSNTRTGVHSDTSGTEVYWGHEMLIRHLENQFGSVLVCDGALFCVRGVLYQPCIPELANDLDLPLRIAHAGYWILHEPKAQVEEKDTSSPWEELSRRRRICAQGVLGMWKLRHTLHGVRAWQFVSHKCMRWLLAVPISLLMLSSLLLSRQFIFAFFLAAQVTFWSIALIGLFLISLGKHVPGAVRASVYFLISIIGAFLGVVEACTGTRFAVWESPALSRGVTPPRYKESRGSRYL